MYKQLTGTGSASRWVNRFEQSRDGFATHKDLVLATVPASTPALQFLPYLGDYNMLLSRGNELLGIFSANNTPDPANFPSGVAYQRRVSQATHQLLDASGSPVDVSIDPFFFSVPVMPLASHAHSIPDRPDRPDIARGSALRADEPSGVGATVGHHLRGNGDS